MVVPSLLLLNARSIAPCDKLDDLTLSCSSLEPDFCVVTETWLNKSHDSCYFQIPNYSLLRKDRVGRTGGGVAVWMKNNITCSVLPNLNFPPFAECLCLSFRMGIQIYLLCAVYYPPNLCHASSTAVVEALVDTIDEWSTTNIDGEIIIAGDLNDLDVDSLCRTLDLVKKVTSPTRKQAILDHFLVSSGLDNFYPDATVGPPLSTSRRGSHGQVHLQPYGSLPTSTTSRCSTVLDLRKPNVDAFLSALQNSSFLSVYKLDDIDKKVAAFYGILENCLKCIPRTSVYMTARDKPWMSPHLKNMINLRWKAYRSRNFTEYNRLKNVIQKEIIQAKRRWIARSSNSANTLWKTVNEFSGKRKGRSLDPLLSKHKDMTSALNHLNSIFCEVFQAKQQAHLPNDDSDWAPLVDISDINEFFRHLKVNKSSGSDGISNFLYKIASPFLCEPLCNIVNSSILQRRVPLMFKRCDISPVPKRLPVTEDQLRPISLLSIPSKLLEHCILKSSKNLFLSCVPHHQFAYKPLSNTTCALISLHDAITKMLEDKDVVGAAMVSYDFSKAFDTLAHHHLIEKLLILQFPPGLVLWIEDYLNHRFQRVRIGDSKSKSLPITSGVPQGSLLGPYLFLIMAHDFSSFDPASSVCQYADDTTVAFPFRSLSDLCNRMDNEMSHMQQWSTSNGFRLNSSKSQCLLVCKKSYNDIPSQLRFPQQHESIRILGVTWTSSLSWDAHFKLIEEKCVRRLYLLRVLRNIVSHDELWRVFDAVIANALLYAVELFGPPSSVTRAIVNRLFKRSKHIICGYATNCECGLPVPFDIIRETRVQKLLSKAQEPKHPLYSIVCHPNDRGSFVVPFSRTSRRQKCFTVFSVLMHTKVHID